jgi:hypothetical protein
MNTKEDSIGKVEQGGLAKPVVSTTALNNQVGKPSSGAHHEAV